MVGSIALKSFHSLTVFSMKSPPSSTLSSMKLKTLLHTLIFSHLRHVACALSKAFAQIFNEIHLIHFLDYLKRNKKKKKNKHFLGSFRFHYNWGSSHVLPVPPHVLDECHVYYDPAWNSIVSAECDDEAEAELSEYLHWLELEEQVIENPCTGRHHMNEIDKLADIFISSNHEKFKLEKEDSYRRFQEMMARSV